MARRPPAEGHDPSRREFFRTFSRQTIQNAGAVAGAAAELRRTSLDAARDLLDAGAAAARPLSGPSTIATPGGADALPEPNFRSAYRYTGDSIVVLDQRELPSRVITFECRAPSDIASAVRSRAITSGPVVAQVAAYGVAMAAAGVVDRPDESRDQVIRGAADTIKAARGESQALRWAVDRMVARYNELANGRSSGLEVRAALVAEADAITSEAAAAHAEIGRLWAGLVSELSTGAGTRAADSTINVLVHGDTGPLACGLVGMGTAGIQALIEDGRQVHVWVTEAAPSGEGARLAALELTQLGVPHTVLPDSAAGWLFANRRLDAVVLRGDTIAGNGETAALLGAVTVAQLAHDADVAVHVLAPESAWDRASRNASQLVLDLRSAAELGSADRARLNPQLDIVPARLTTAYVSERIVVRPPFKEPRS
jgi:methylthioribose-1-phosphate isomerase